MLNIEYDRLNKQCSICIANVCLFLKSAFELLVAVLPSKICSSLFGETLIPKGAYRPLKDMNLRNQIRMAPINERIRILLHWSNLRESSSGEPEMRCEALSSIKEMRK